MIFKKFNIILLAFTLFLVDSLVISSDEKKKSEKFDKEVFKNEIKALIEGKEVKENIADWYKKYLLLSPFIQTGVLHAMKGMVDSVDNKEEEIKIEFNSFDTAEAMPAEYISQDIFKQAVDNTGYEKYLLVDNPEKKYAYVTFIKYLLYKKIREILAKLKKELYS